MRKGIDLNNIILWSIGILLSFSIFYMDLYAPNELNISIFYSLVIIYSWVLNHKYASSFFAVLSSIFIFSTIGIKPVSENLDKTEHINRVFAMVIIWICAVLIFLIKNALKTIEKNRNDLQLKIEERTSDLRAINKKLKLTNQEIEHSELKFKNLMNSAPDALIIVNEAGIIELSNNQAEILCGYKKTDLIGRKLDLLLPDKFTQDFEKIMKANFLNSKSGAMSAGNEVLIQCSDGKFIPVEISLSPIKSNGKTLIISAIRDIRERISNQELKAIAKEAEVKNNELAQFAYVASHDLREPLITISSMIELIQMELKEIINDELKTYMNAISDSSKRMNDLIIDLLEYSRIGREKDYLKIDLQDSLNIVLKDIDHLVKSSNTKIESNQLPIIYGVEYEIKLLFQNLLTNAIKYRSKENSPFIKISYEELENYHQISISDNGIGIDSKYHSKIFEAFQRLHNDQEYDGNGIGLAHCKKIVNHHGGKIYVSSELNKGCVFTFTIQKKLWKKIE